MGNLAVIDMVLLSPLAREPVFGGPPALERTLAWASELPEWQGTVLLASASDELPPGCAVMNAGELSGNALVGNTLPGKALSENAPTGNTPTGKAPTGNTLSETTRGSGGFLKAIVREKWNEEELVKALMVAAGLPLEWKDKQPVSAQALFFLRADAALPDTQTSRTLWELHYRYDAEYTFADGYPEGLVPQILSAELPSRLLPLARGRKGPVARDSLFEILRQDINAFDVETHLAPEDLRMERVSVTCDTRRNKDIAEKLYAAGGTDAESLCRIIPRNRHLLRSLPAYFPIQITDHSPQSVSYCPFARRADPRKGGSFMDSGRFVSLCERIVDFAGDAVFSLSPVGEPASHPDIENLIRAALKVGERDKGPPVTRVLVETSGIGWKEGVLESLAADFSDGRLIWILAMDAADEELYRRIRGEGLREAEAAARKLHKLFGSHFYLQAVRMEENEDHLEEFYRKWKDEGVQVIIQKYNTFGGLLPQKQPADLSPLDRFPCWHLKRDMPVLLDGSVPLSWVHTQWDEPAGNVFSHSLEEIWEAGGNLHRQHVNGEYPGCCGECDEYYTFNF